jgi:hypothetical protein
MIGRHGALARLAVFGHDDGGCMSAADHRQVWRRRAAAELARIIILIPHNEYCRIFCEGRGLGDRSNSVLEENIAQG